MANNTSKNIIVYDNQIVKNELTEFDISVFEDFSQNTLIVEPVVQLVKTTSADIFQNSKQFYGDLKIGTHSLEFLCRDETALQNIQELSFFTDFRLGQLSALLTSAIQITCKLNVIRDGVKERIKIIISQASKINGDTRSNKIDIMSQYLYSNRFVASSVEQAMLERRANIRQIKLKDYLAESETILDLSSQNIIFEIVITNDIRKSKHAKLQFNMIKALQFDKTIKTIAS